MNNSLFVSGNDQRFSSRIRKVPRSGVREILKAAEGNEIISFGGGVPHESCIPVEIICKSFDNIFTSYGHKAFSYGQTEGEPLLREFIAEVWLPRQGIAANPSDILIVNGSQQALDLLGKVFVDKGAPVLVERPTYMAALQALCVYEPQFLEIEMDTEGVFPDQMEIQLKRDACRFFYTIPSFQNPSGVCYTEKRRLEVIGLLNKYRTLLVEDDPYSNLYFENPPPLPLCSMGAENAVYIGTFSKIVAPGFRLGWIYAKPDIMRHLVTVKQASDLCTGRFGQLLLFDILKNLDLDIHLKNLRLFYHKQRDSFEFFMKKYMSEFLQWKIPSGGMFFWASTFGPAASELLVSCITRGVAFADGDSFHASGGGKQYMRLNFTQASEQMMERGLSVLKEQIQLCNNF